LETDPLNDGGLNCDESLDCETTERGKSLLTPTVLLVMDTTFEPAVAVTGELDELNPEASVEAREVFVLLLP